MNALAAIQSQLTSQSSAARSEAVDVARNFERIFVTQMIEGFRKTQIGESDGMFGKGPGASTYAQWFDDHMARHLTDTANGNRGVGLSKVIIGDLERLGQIPKLADPKVNHVA